MTTIVSGSSITFNDNTTQNTSAYGGGFAMRNRIINGDCRIDQRNAGASIASPADQYTLDRWSSRQAGGGVASIQQSSVAPTSFTKSLLLTVTTADSSVTGTDRYFISQIIEGYNVADLGWGTANASTVTLSFWVRSSITGTYGGAFQNGNGDRSYAFTYTISVANTWEQKSITIAGDTTGTWATDNSAAVQIRFGLGVGSTLTTAAGSWTAGNFISANSVTNWISTNGATFYITGVQLEKGSTATSFDYRPYGTELALCQRYCLKLGGDSDYVPYGTGNNYSTTNGTMVVNFPVAMRAVPTLTVTTPNRVLSGSVANSVTAMSLGNGGALAAYIDYTSTGLTIGYGSYLTSNGSTAGRLLFSSEL